MDNVDDDEYIYQEWFTNRNVSSSTQKIYRITLEDFKAHTGKSLSELVDIGEEEQLSGVLMRKRSVNKYIIDYKTFLDKKYEAKGTINNKMAAIFSFYRAFRIDFPEITLAKGDICLEKNYHRPPNKKEINNMINVASPKDAAIIYVMALTGMASKEVRNLTVGRYLEIAEEAIGRPLRNVNDLFEHEDEVLQEVLTLELTRKKVNYRHQTFIPPEASRAIISYLKSRVNHRNKKQHIKSLSDPLFITRTGGKMTRTGIGNNMRRLGQIAGLKEPTEKGTYRYWRPHSLRKYFISTIINEIGDHILADYLAGHKISNVKRAYWHAKPEKLMEKYLRALPFLSLDEIKVKDLDSAELKESKRELEESRKELEESKRELQESKEELKESKGRMDSLERKFEILESLMEDKITRKELDKRGV